MILIERFPENIASAWLGLLCATALVYGSETPASGDNPTQATVPVAQVMPKRPELPLEFRGVLIDDEGEFFKILDRDTQNLLWLGLNEIGHPFVVRRYDNRRQVLTVEYQHRMIALPLRNGQKRKMEPIPRRLMTDEAMLERGVNTAGELKSATYPASDQPATLTQSSGLLRREAVSQEINGRRIELQADGKKSAEASDASVENKVEDGKATP